MSELYLEQEKISIIQDLEDSFKINSDFFLLQQEKVCYYNL